MFVKSLVFYPEQKIKMLILLCICCSPPCHRPPYHHGIVIAFIIVMDRDAVIKDMEGAEKYLTEKNITPLFQVSRVISRSHSLLHVFSSERNTCVMRAISYLLIELIYDIE